MTRLLHFGDLQLGAGKNLGALPGSRLRDQEEVLDRIVSLAIELEVDALVNGGDTFEGPEVSAEQYEAFQRPMRRLREAGIPALVCQGNGRHDLAKRDVTATAVVQDVCEVFPTPGLRRVGDTYVAFLPWCPIDRLVADEDGGDRAEIMQAAADRLVSMARGLMAGVPADSPSILVPHFSIEGASLPNGLPVAELGEIILPLHDLQALGFDAIVASHIHKPQYALGSEAVWHEVDPAVDGGSLSVACAARGIVLYTGSPLPIDFGEKDTAHGVWLIDTEPAGEPLSADFIPIPSRPLVTLECDLTEDGNEEVLDEIVNGDYFNLGPRIDGAIVKVRYTATAEQAARINHAKLEAAIVEAGASRVMPFDRHIVRSSRARVEGIDETLGELDAVAAWATANDLDPAVAEQLRELTAALLEQATAAAASAAGGLRPLRVRASNYRTYADLDFAFPDGLVAFTGENGSGKSSAINLADVCLFAGRGELAELIRTGEDAMWISLDFESAGTTYRVRRSLRRGKSQTVDLEVQLFESPEQWEPISLASADETNRRIVEITGLSRATFRASVFLRQRDRSSFTDCGAAARKHTLIEIIGLEEWERLLAQAKALATSDEAGMTQLVRRAEVAEQATADKPAVEARLAANRGLSEQAAAAVTVTEAAVEAAQNAVSGNATAAERVRTVQAEFAAAGVAHRSAQAQADEARAAAASRVETQGRLAEAAELANRVPDLEARVHEMRASKAKADAAIAARSALEEKASSLAFELERRTCEHEDRKSAAARLHEKAAELRDHPSEDQVCERCEQHLDEEARIRAIASYLTESADLTQKLSDEKPGLLRLAQDLATVRTAAEEASVPEVVDPAPVEAELAKARAATEERARLSTQLQALAEKAAPLPRLQEELFAAAAAVEAASGRLNEARAAVGDTDALAAAVERARAQLSAARGEATRLAEQIARDAAGMERIEAAERQLAEVAGEREFVQSRLDLLAVACKAYGRDGVPALVVENSAIPVMEEIANDLLQQFETAYRIEFRTQRELKSEALAETLDIIVHDGVDDRPLETYSEGEQSAIAIVCRVALERLLRSRGKGSTALLIDEPEFLSERRSLLLVEILRRLSADLETVVLVTHNSAAAASCDRQIEFVKENDTSRIVGAPAAKTERQAVPA